MSTCAVEGDRVDLQETVDQAREPADLARRAGTDAGERPGVTTDEGAQMRDFEGDNKGAPPGQ